MYSVAEFKRIIREKNILDTEGNIVTLPTRAELALKKLKEAQQNYDSIVNQIADGVKQQQQQQLRDGSPVKDTGRKR